MVTELPYPNCALQVCLKLLARCLDGYQGARFGDDGGCARCAGGGLQLRGLILADEYDRLIDGDDSRSGGCVDTGCEEDAGSDRDARVHSAEVLVFVVPLLAWPFLTPQLSPRHANP